MDPILEEKELAASWNEVKAAELKAIERRRENAGLAPDPTQASAPQQLVGVALSGGGIRSASFNLGFLQALVQRKLMRYVDFLATVSGGGYIGAFFSSLAHARWRERGRTTASADSPTAPSAGAPLPITADPQTHQQPETVQTLVAGSSYLNDLPGFFNRYLVGTFLLNLTFVSGVVLVCTLLAYLWRVMDQQTVVNYFIWYSNSFLVEARRPFFPAFLVFTFLWLPAWLWSFYRHGTGAPARHSGKFLVLLLISILVGVAIWLATPNMNFANVLSANYAAKDAQLSTVPSQLIYPVAALLLVCLAPFIRPTELLKSGQQSDTPWKRWVFNIAGFALLVGVPFLLVYYIGRHNVSGVADRWDRDLQAFDVLDWEDLILRVTNEKIAAKDDVTRPGIELYKHIKQEGKQELKTEINNTVKMVKLNRKDHESFLDYMTAQAFKEKTAALMNEAISQYKYSYDILKSLHESPSETPHAAGDKRSMWKKPIIDALDNLEKLTKDQPDAYKKGLMEVELPKIRELLDSFSGRMSNAAMIDKLAAEFPDFIKDEQARLKLTAKDVEDIRSQVRGMDDERDRKSRDIANLMGRSGAATAAYQAAQDKIKELTEEKSRSAAFNFQQKVNPVDTEIARLQEHARKMQTESEIFKKAAEAQQEELNTLIANHRLARERIYTAKEGVRDEWYKIFFPTGIQPKAAGHLLLRLFYPENFREIQFVTRPLVIAADQEFRGWLLVGSFVSFVVCGFLIDFNYTSLHGYYKSRLQRAFLARFKPDAEGEEHRDLPLAAMKNVEEGQPYHILCGTAEAVHGRRLEHTLTAFQFAQLYCGSTELGFAKTEAYGEGKLSLADGMSISGAAVNPMRIENLLVKILLVVTNFRLGQWLPHPLRGPRGWFVPFFRIASALMQKRPTNSEKFVFVSDGGFYDNLGIDVLLDRRCRLIVASDAGADERIELADLARLYRLCQDKGIRLVNLHDDKCITMEAVLAAVKTQNVAICRILYPGDGEGLLFHVKSFLVPPATLDLAQYKVTHAQFPHDATTNQFFDEVQFKCYQQLGWQIGQRVCDDLFPDEWGEKPIQVERLKDLLVEKSVSKQSAPSARAKQSKGAVAS